MRDRAASDPVFFLEFIAALAQSAHESLKLLSLLMRGSRNASGFPSPQPHA